MHTCRAATTDKKAAKNWGNLVLAVDPELMGDKAEFAVRRRRVSVGSIPPLERKSIRMYSK